VILVDANLLIYARVAGMPQHEPARFWLDEQLNTMPSVGLPWPSLMAFLRIVTNPRATASPVEPRVAWAAVREWLAVESVWIPVPTDRHAEVLDRLLDGSFGGDLLQDAHLAALAIEHGLTLASTDGDVARFAGLRWLNPLAA
jgi:uncharacterized protein